MIHGKLPNDTIWWLSKDGLKIWIESRDLEIKKFTEKSYNINYDRLYKERVGEVGELTSSRLESRKWKKAWVIKLGPMIDIYPELMEEINRQTIEEKKRKKTVTRPAKRGIKPNKVIDNKPKIEITEPQIESPEHKIEIANPKIEIVDSKIEVTECNAEVAVTDCKQETIENSENVAESKAVKEFKKETARDFFDKNRPYVAWLKDEIDKNGKLTITYKKLKEKMGEEFVKMPDLRIQYGLKKVLSNIGIKVDPGMLQKESALVMERVLQTSRE